MLNRYTAERPITLDLQCYILNILFLHQRYDYAHYLYPALS
jgi:hypothetical protein